MQPVTDPALLAQLNGGNGLSPVTDPELLKQLNSDQPQDAPVTAGGLVKAAGAGAVKGLVDIPSDAVSLWNLAKRGYREATGGTYDPAKDDTQLPQGYTDLQKKADQLYTPKNSAEDWTKWGAGFAPAIVTGPEGIAGKGVVGGAKALAKRAALQAAAPYAASQAASSAAEGTPLEPYAGPAAALVTGGLGVRKGIKDAAKVAETTALDAKSLSPAGQVAHDAVADAIEQAKTSSNKRDGIRSAFRDLKSNDAVMSSLTPDQQGAVTDLASTSAHKGMSEAAALGVLTTETFLPTGVPTALFGASRIASKIGDRIVASRALRKAEALRQDILRQDGGPQAPAPAAPVVRPGPTGPAIAPAPQPWGAAPAPQPAPAAPQVPDPKQLVAQMNALVNARKVARAQQIQNAQPLLRQLAATGQAPAPTPAPAPAPVAPQVPQLPDPQQLKLQMAALVNSRKAIAGRAAAAQKQAQAAPVAQRQVQAAPAPQAPQAPAAPAPVAAAPGEDAQTALLNQKIAQMRATRAAMQPQSISKKSGGEVKAPINFDTKTIAEGNIPVQPNQTVIHVDPQALNAAYKATDPEFANNLMSGRTEKLKQHVANGGPVSLPEVGAVDGRLGFTNGRHRAQLAADMGLKSMPVAVEKANAEAVKALVAKHATQGAYDVPEDLSIPEFLRRDATAPKAEAPASEGPLSGVEKSTLDFVNRYRAGALAKQNSITKQLETLQADKRFPKGDADLIEKLGGLRTISRRNAAEEHIEAIANKQPAPVAAAIRQHLGPEFRKKQWKRVAKKDA